MRVFFISAFVLLALVSYTQTNTYVEDLRALKLAIEKTASFKAQIKGEKVASYNDLYNRLLSDSSNNANNYTYFYNLAQLLFPLKDNHLGFYQYPNANHFRSKESVDSFVQSKAFHDYPSSQINLDSLRDQLSKKPADSIEGIYHYDQFYSIGLFKKNEIEYIGVVLNSTIHTWEKGQIAIHLYEYGPNLYKAIYGHPKFKNFIFQPVEKFQNQSLVNAHFYSSFSNAVYSKKISVLDHVNLPISSSKFALRNINKDVQYLMIQSFQNKNTIKQQSQLFSDSIKTLLNTPYLIVDLRNNEGGADSEMKRYLKLLKEYVKNGQLYVLVNNGTLSQAEIFTIELKALKNVTIIGQQSKGMLAYGSNYGKKERLPSGQFEIYLTDMNNGSSLLKYEDVGISPDIVLRNDRDWIEQVLSVIKK